MELFSQDKPVQLGPLATTLANKIKGKQAVIGVVGLGYVGLPIALEYCKKGFTVLGVDVSVEKIASLQKGVNYIEDLSDEEIAHVVKVGLLKATTDFGQLAQADVIYIAVPTPFNDNKDPDLSYILNSGREVGKTLSKGKLVILKSTTFPGTTEDYLIPELNISGLQAGTDYFIAFSPERVDPGNKQFHTGNTPIVVGGVNPESTYLTALVNNQIIEQVYCVSNPKVAELEKLLENIFRSVNIALVNELALLCERMKGINVWEVIDAAGTKPFGYMKFMPGPGVGGHCIPIDPYYLSWLARAYDFEAKFITLSANTNESMPYHVVNKVVKIIADQPVALKQARILILGAAFKKNVKDLRHSPSEPIIINLLDAGFTNIDVADPWVLEYEAGGRVFKTVELSPETLKGYHAAVLVTDHDLFDANYLLQHSNHIVDTRNFFANATDRKAVEEKVVLLGYSK
jgi:UDP-N-acetyl-D-glucosamine dehydrogenase